MHHPWRRFRHLVEWTLRWSDRLPLDVRGETDFDRKMVTLASGLTQAERRCTIAHETEHAVRGPVPDFYWPREERAIDETVARRLITLDALVDALLWARDDHELAEELWVDVATVRARLASLTDEETAIVNCRLDAAEVRTPFFRG
jgi:hypothetical protein